MRNIKKFIPVALILIISAAGIYAQDQQSVEGFDKIEFHYNANKTAASRDFRGMAPGYMTAGWWAEGQTKKNVLSWKTATVPAKKPTVFSFIAASAVLPSEFTRGPYVKMSVNGTHAITFRLGYTRDFTWKEGEFELKYISKRVEYPYFGSHRQFELNGNSGIYQLRVPDNLIMAGQAVTIGIELVPFTGWNGGCSFLMDVLWQRTAYVPDLIQSPVALGHASVMTMARPGISRKKSRLEMIS